MLNKKVLWCVPLMHLVQVYKNENYGCENGTPTIITYTSIFYVPNLCS